MTIVKRGKQHCVVSHTGKNLGCGASHAWAAKRLGQVEYFKHAHKSLTEDVVLSSIEDGSLVVSDNELSGWMYANKSLLAPLGVDMDQPEMKGLFSSEGGSDGTDEHISTEQLRSLLFDIFAGTPPPQLELKTFDQVEVLSHDHGVVVLDGCRCCHELTVLLVSSGMAIMSMAASQERPDFDPESELAEDLVAYLQGQDLAGLTEVRALPSTSYNDGAEFAFSDGTVMDVIVRCLVKQAHDPDESVTRPIDPSLQTVTMHMLSETKSAAASYQCFEQMRQQYGGTETGELLNKGKTLFDNGSYSAAASMFQKARDTLDPTTYPTQTYHNCANDWASYAQDLTLPPKAVGT